MAWDCGAGHYLDLLLRRRLALNIFPFPVTTAELIGEFYNNRRSAAHGCPRFAYSFMFLMLRQYNWRCDSYSAIRRSAANMKIRKNLIIDAAKASRFAYKRRVQRSANNIFYIAPIVLVLSRSYRFTYSSRTRL
jgi:hypothetical protein